MKKSQRGRRWWQKNTLENSRIRVSWSELGGGDQIGPLTKPQSCCRPCSKQAIVKALLLPPIRKSSVKALCRFWNHDFLTSLPTGVGKVPLLAASSSSEISLSIAPSTSSTIELLPPYTLFKILCASWEFPLFTSHLGVSGKNNKSPNCTTAGAAPNPTIHLHP